MYLVVVDILGLVIHIQDSLIITFDIDLPRLGRIDDHVAGGYKIGVLSRALHVKNLMEF